MCDFFFVTLTGRSEADVREQRGQLHLFGDADVAAHADAQRAAQLRDLATGEYFYEQPADGAQVTFVGNLHYI